MTIEELKNYLIERGIKSCSQEEKKYEREGCVEGFNICRTLNLPEDFEDKLKELGKKQYALMVKSDLDKVGEIEEYWKLRYIILQVEFVFERMKAAWKYPVLSAQAVKDYTRIVGVEGRKRRRK